VSGTYGPWGQWYATVVDANNFTLNGSGTNGSSGTGGYFTTTQQYQFTPMSSIDLANQGLDGQPTSYLQVYLWENQRFFFRGANQQQQLRITYWASGTPPANTSTVINIDNCIDFLANATAYKACMSLGWEEFAETFRQCAYGDGTQGAGLIGDFVNFQVRQLQKGPLRRLLPFRPKKSKFGSWVPSI
jgi:hypothetical protein